MSTSEFEQLLESGIRFADPTLRLVSSEPRPGVHVVTVSGDLDASTASTLADYLIDALREAPRLLVVDVSTLSFLGAAGLSSMLRGKKCAEDRGSRFVVVTGDRRVVTRPIAVTGLYRELELRPTLEVALAG